MTQDDVAWKPDLRESWGDIQNRVNRFLAWLCQRQESSVAVVTHGVWMEALFRTHDPLVLGDKRVYNGDVFVCRVVSRNGQFMRIERTLHISGPMNH